MTLPTVRSFGPYELVSALGAGGMGQVYRARDSRLGRYVAIKILPPEFSSDPERLRRFEQEAKAAAALNHPGIVAIFDVGTTEDGAPFLVSELLEGHTLGHYVRTERLPLRTVIDYALQIARGLAAAHDRGIIHRDLKPDNVFVTRDGVVKILDFGLAKLMDTPHAKPEDKTVTVEPSDTLPGMILGTVGYMSPEQVRGRPTDHRTDIFAFGAILYEMLAGKPAFREATDPDTQAAILKDDPPVLTATNTSIPSTLEQIVWHCLEKDPSRRFQSASDVAFSLQALSTSTLSSRVSLPSESLASSIPWRKVVLGAVVALGIGLGAFWLGHRWSRVSVPIYQQLTYQPISITSARFSPDGHTVLCAARVNHGFEIYSVRLDSPGLRSLDLEAQQILSVSSRGELAILKTTQMLEGSTEVGLLSRVPLGGGAPKPIFNDVQFADWSRDGNELAVSRYIPEKHVFRLEYPIGNVLFETSGWIGSLRLSPDGHDIAFVDRPTFGDDLGYVAVIPSAGGAVKRLTRLWGDIRGLAWDPRGSQIWYAATDIGFNYALHKVTLAGNDHYVLAVPGGLILDDIAADGRVLATHSIERTVVMVSTRDHPDEQNLAWLDNTEFFRFSPDGKQILMGDESETSGVKHGSFLRNLDGSSAVRLGDGDGIAVSPDGQWALSRIPPNQLVLLPTGAGEVKQVSADSPGSKDSQHNLKSSIKADLSADWFPDSKRIAYVAEDNRTHLLDLDGNEKVLTPPGLSGYLVTSDGQYILVQDKRANYSLYPVDGGSGKSLPFLHSTDQPIRFSAAANDLFIYTPEQHSGPSIYRVNLETGHRTLLQRLPSSRSSTSNEISLIDVTPDGTGYAYGYRQKSNALYVISGLQ